MPDFTLVSPDRENIRWLPSLPDRYLGQSLAASSSIMAECSFGDLVFSHFAGEGFDIWKNSYHINRNARVIGQSNQPALELSCTLDAGPEVNLQGIYAGPLAAQQVELYFSPCVDNLTTFQAGKTYRSLDIHFQTSLLESYARDCPRLEQILNASARGEPARLFGETVCAPPRMTTVLRELAGYSYMDYLAPRYYDSYVHILLMLLAERVSAFRPGTRLISPANVALAQEAKQLLTADYQASLTIAQLCRKLGTNPYLLKTAFKQVIGVSIGKYKKGAFMEYARQLLLDTVMGLEDISILLGYNSQQSFNTAFRNHFGRTPGSVRRGGR